MDSIPQNPQDKSEEISSVRWIEEKILSERDIDGYEMSVLKFELSNNPSFEKSAKTRLEKSDGVFFSKINEVFIKDILPKQKNIGEWLSLPIELISQLIKAPSELLRVYISGVSCSW